MTYSLPVIPGYNVSYAVTPLLAANDPPLPRGKGIYIWNFPKCGTPQQIADGCAELGLQHVIIKIADGIYSYPTKAIHGFEYDTAELVRLLKAKGIQCWGYQFIYGNDPIGEAKVGFDRMVALRLFGFVINAESYFRPNRFEPAQDYMTKLNSLAPLMSVALSSNRYPLTSWTDFPWSSFRNFIEFDMPQVYWVGAHNPRAQLRESYRQFQKLSPQLSYVPTGSTWEQQVSGDKPYWVCTAADVIEFMDTAKELGLPAVNFWEYSRLKVLPNVWQAIADYDFGGAPVPPEPIPQPGEDEMATILEKIKAIKDAYPDAAINIGVQFTEGAPAPDDGGDGGGGDTSNVRYRVDTTGKANNQVKVRPTPDASVGQLYFVYHGNIVGGSGRIQNEFLYVDTINALPANPPGWVEMQWLKKLA